MKSIYIVIYSCIILVLGACGETNSSVQQPSTAPADSTKTVKPSPKPEKLSIEQGINIIPEQAADERGYYWGTPLIVELAQGFSLVSPSADKGKKDWMFEAYSLEQKGKEIYAFPHKKEDMRATVISSQKDKQWYPKVLTKGNKTGVLMLRYLGEDVEPAHVVDLIKIENGEFVAYLENVIAYDYTADLKPETLEKLFAKSFE